MILFTTHVVDVSDRMIGVSERRILNIQERASKEALELIIAFPRYDSLVYAPACIVERLEMVDRWRILERKSRETCKAPHQSLSPKRWSCLNQT